MPDRQIEREIKGRVKDAVAGVLAECGIDPELSEHISDVLEEIIDEAVEKLVDTGKQDKKLGNSEADRVAQQRGYEGAEDAKKQLGVCDGGKYDIFRRSDGTPVVKPKDGSAPGEPF